MVGISFGVPTSKFPCLERCQLCIISILSLNSSSQNDYGIFFILSKNDKFFGFFVVVVFYFGFVVVVVVLGNILIAIFFIYFYFYFYFFANAATDLNAVDR